jgi:hypothetical protein
MGYGTTLKQTEFYPTDIWGENNLRYLAKKLNIDKCELVSN